MKKIIHFVHNHATPEAVFRALTTEEGLSGWWTNRVRAQTGVGGVISFRFTADSGPEMEIARLERNRRVEWKCIAGHANWKDNTFSFELGRPQRRDRSDVRAGVSPGAERRGLRNVQFQLGLLPGESQASL